MAEATVKKDTNIDNNKDKDKDNDVKNFHIDMLLCLLREKDEVIHSKDKIINSKDELVDFLKNELNKKNKKKFSFSRKY